MRYRRFLLTLLVLAAAFGINTLPGCGATQYQRDLDARQDAFHDLHGESMERRIAEARK